MASTDAANGLEPWECLKRERPYAIVTNNAVAISIGDMVETAGAAVFTQLHGNLLMIITEETGAAGSIVGVVTQLLDSDGYPVDYIAASTTGNSVIAGYALVADHPDQTFKVQEDGDTSSIQVADIGLNADMISTQTATESNGYLSKMELDSDTVATTATLALKVWGVHPDDTISPAGAAGNHCRFLVKINTHFHGDGIVGV